MGLVIANDIANPNNLVAGVYNLTVTDLMDVSTLNRLKFFKMILFLLTLPCFYGLF